MPPQLPRVAALAVGFLLAAVAGLEADDLRGRVVSVADGDTITVLDAGRMEHRIRLNGIDAPESRQPFSQVSRRQLSELVAGRDVLVVWDKRDRYGRLIGTVLVDGTNANLAQLTAGLAWYYRYYAADVPADLRPRYEAAEADARAARRGLWADPQPVAPWGFRNPSLGTSTPQTAVSAPTGAGRIIGNRNSRIYHLPGCRSYNAVAERNRVPFTTEAEARAAGYRKARNCP